jgi:hypothetical protein
MTAVTTSTGTSAASAQVPYRPLPLALRIGLAVAAPLAPLAQGLGYLLSPYGNSDDPETIFGAIARNPEVVDVLSWLSLIAGLTLIPGIIATGLAALPRASRLATAALLIAVPGWSAGLLFPNTDLVAAAAATTEVPEANAVRLVSYLLNFSTPALTAVVLIFVVGHIAGTVLLGIALFFSRAVPRVIAVLLIVSQPLHFVAFVILQNTYLDIAAAGLTATGFGAAGLSLLRSSQGSRSR